MSNERDSTLQEKDTRSQRIAVFLLIFVLHGLLVAVLIRERKLVLFSKHDSSNALLVYFLPREASPIRDALKAESPSKILRRKDALEGKTPLANAPNAPITPPIEMATPTTQIDWQHELELAVQNRVANEEAEKAYRDLSKSMSPSQVDWLKQHHMEPASPGLTWKKPRVEITKGGMPIVHINDHCVLVPLLFVPMVFCSRRPPTRKVLQQPLLGATCRRWANRRR
jgi:hypothetical protein